MFLNKFLLIGGGLTIAGTGTGLGVYYSVNSGGSSQPQTQVGETEGRRDSETVENSLSEGSVRTSVPSAGDGK